MSVILRVAILVVAVASTDAFAGKSIALVGNNYRAEVLSEFASIFGSQVEVIGNERKAFLGKTGDVVMTLSPGATNIQIANQLKNADVAVIVVDSTIGPLPIDREHIIIARQTRVPVITVLLANLEKLHRLAPKDAAELLELEELEMRELLSSYEMGGDSTLFFYDRDASNRGPPVSGMGVNETFKTIFKLNATKNAPTLTKKVRQFYGNYYLLSQPEANNKGISLKKNKTIAVWSEGTTSLGTVISDGHYNPGDVTELSIKIDGNLVGDLGSRIILFNDKDLVGIGVISKIQR